MKALTYLLLTLMKNRILSLKKKPGMLILYAAILAIVLFSVILLLVTGKELSTNHYADERILYLIIAGLGLLFVWLFINTGLSTGSSLFTMPDVGLLFVAPISPKKILMYGLLSTLGKSLLASAFIFYQVGNLKNNFGFGLKEIFSLFLIYTIMIIACQLLSIGIYIFSNGNPSRKNIVKSILYGLFAVMVLVAVLIQRQEQVSIIEAFLQLTASSWFGYIPIAGWTTMFFMGVVQNSFPMILLPLILFLVMGVLTVSLLTAGKADYYEDVLLSTETTYQTQKAAKEGRRVAKNREKAIKIKDNEQGINRGKGAITLTYKNILEMKRKSKLIFVDGYTIFITLAAGIAGYYFRKYQIPGAAAYAILGAAVYIQLIVTMMGKLQGELLKPYIYLIPEKSIKKVFAASITSLIKPCIDGIFMFAVLAAIWGNHPLICLFSAIGYAASGTVFVGLTILYQRVLGGQPNKLVQMFLGFILLFIIMAPAIGTSVAAAILLPEALQFLCTLPYSMFCLMFAALIFVTCGNLIDKAEFTGRL